MLRRGVIALVVLAAGCGGDDDLDPPVPPTPSLTLPALFALPYVAAGAGASTQTFEIPNLSGAAVEGLTWRVVGDADFTVDATSVAPVEGAATVSVSWAGASAPRIAGASLVVASPDVAGTIELWAVAGDPALDEPAFEPVTGANGVRIGDSAILHLPTAPFPAAGRPWTDDRVHVFVPVDYREDDAHDVVLHFHGHSTTIAATVPAHAYREQVYASGANVVLVVPQGPVDAASGDFGKLADPDGTAAFLDQVIAELYRAGRLERPVLGQLTLTSHSGGYTAVAQNLAPAPFVVGQVDLFDSVYGNLATYRDFALAGGWLRSNYTASGGTDDNNRALAAQLDARGVVVATTPTQRHLREPEPVIYPTAATHTGSTRDDGAFGEALRWGHQHGRRGPRLELRAVQAAGARADVRWLAPIDDEVVGFRVETSPDGTTWSTAAEVGPDQDRVQLGLAAAVWVRVLPIVDGVARPQPSDSYRVAPAADVLVVDGFDRVVDGSWGGLAHDFAARVGAAAGAADTASNEAITEDGLELSAYRAVIWLVGDESTADHTFTAAERAALDRYLAGGGHLIVSGSEIGYDLGGSSAGATWLAATVGARFAADSAGTGSARGTGPFLGLGSFDFGGSAAPYREDFPDSFTAGPGAMVVVQYASGGAAALGLPGRAAIVGFPLETVESPAALAALVPALLAFVAP